MLRLGALVLIAFHLVSAQFPTAQLPTDGALNTSCEFSVPVLYPFSFVGSIRSVFPIRYVYSWNVPYGSFAFTIKVTKEGGCGDYLISSGTPLVNINTTTGGGYLLSMTWINASMTNYPPLNFVVNTTYCSDALIGNPPPGGPCCPPCGFGHSPVGTDRFGFPICSSPAGTPWISTFLVASAALVAVFIGPQSRSGLLLAVTMIFALLLIGHGAEQQIAPDPGCYVYAEIAVPLGTDANTIINCTTGGGAYFPTSVPAGVSSFTCTNTTPGATPFNCEICAY